MRGRWMVLALVGLLGLGGLAAAQDEASGGAKTVTRDEVKSWIFEVDGKEWSVRPAAPTAMGDSGLFRLVGSAHEGDGDVVGAALDPQHGQSATATNSVQMQ